MTPSTRRIPDDQPPGGESDPTVVVGYDDSPECRAALAWAVARVRRQQAVLRLVTVVEEEDGAMGAEYAAEATRAAARVVADASQRVSADLPEVTIDLSVVHGPVAWSLAVSTEPEDLLIVGTHIDVEAPGLTLGSRSVQIAAAASGAVVVVPALPPTARAGIVVGVETAADARPVLAAAIAEAGRTDEPLVVVHCSREDAKRHDVERILSAIEDVVSPLRPGLDVEIRHVRARAVETLLELARDATLLVLGRSRQPVLNPLGTTAHVVLTHATSPVLITAVPIDLASEHPDAPPAPTGAHIDGTSS